MATNEATAEAPAQAEAQPVLSLSTVTFDRPVVSIETKDGVQQFYMRAGEEFSLQMMKQIRRRASRVDALQGELDKEGLSDDRVDQLFDKLEALTVEQIQTVMVDLPDKVAGALSIKSRSSIMKHFFGLVRDDNPAS